MPKKTILSVGITADRMPDDKSLRKQLGWVPGTEFTVKRVEPKELFLGLKELLKTYEPSLWERVSDDDGRIERGAISEAQQVALVDRHFEQLGSPTACIIDSITCTAELYPSKTVLEVASYRGLKIYKFHYGELTPIK